MSDLVEVNCSTGEVTVRAMTPEEEAQRVLDVAEAEAIAARPAPPTLDELIAAAVLAAVPTAIAETVNAALASLSTKEHNA
jgi:hypothetical protein